ncbi:MAG: helix-turn-helix transcriptional regulator [Faecousia sp.]
MKYPNIDAERARNGMNADDLAKELGISRKTLYNWLTNGNIPSSALIRMADIFQCSIDYLLGRCCTVDLSNQNASA